MTFFLNEGISIPDFLRIQLRSPEFKHNINEYI